MEGTAHATPVAPGDVLAGKYRVERVLGRGAMGIVVAARHLELGELFAIKLMLPQAAAHAQAVERFLREARAAARIKGEHVARVTDVGRLESGCPYMVMEHLSGSDLQQVVRSSGPLPVAQAILLVLQACEALAEAHALGIVHRDLKPSNLFLTTRANGTPCLKILDFGISKQVEPEAVDLTKTGEVFGTPLYMAPEQMARTKGVDARSDIWSLGAVLYELLTGRSPFHAATLTEVIARALQEEPAPPSSIRPDISPRIDAIVLRCLRKKPAERYQHVADLADALAGIRSHFPASAGSPSVRPLDLPAITSPVSVTSAQEAPTLPLPVSSEPGARPAIPSLGTAPPAANTASAWGTTGVSKSGRGGIGLPLLIGGVVAATLAAAAVWLFADSRGQSGSLDVSVSSPAEPLPPVPAAATAPPPSATTAAPATAAPDLPLSAAATSTSSPPLATVLPTPSSPPLQGKVTAPSPSKVPKPPPKKKYQDAF